jgi:hypothetical protein
MPVTIQMSDDITLDSFRALVYGPTGIGKTVSSLTMSMKLPAAFSHISKPGVPAPAVPVALDDTLWIGLDEGAINGFRQLGVKVPILDLSLMKVAEFDAEVKAAQDAAVKWLGVGGASKTIVIDTISKLDDLLFYKHHQLGGLRKFDLYDAMRVGHKKFAAPFKELKANIIYLAHAKPVFDSGDANQIRGKKASGGAVITPRITGQSLDYYRADATFIFPIVREKDASGGDGHYFLTKDRDFECKSRLKLADKIPADWREVRKVASATVAA